MGYLSAPDTLLHHNLWTFLQDPHNEHFSLIYLAKPLWPEYDKNDSLLARSRSLDIKWPRFLAGLPRYAPRARMRVKGGGVGKAHHEGPTAALLGLPLTDCLRGTRRVAFPPPLPRRRKPLQD